ncbi:helix-turn-helix transcriptional regulator [Methylobacterium soli]|uniref:Helix-turn-helix transcriptional regulator n=1 Tax=Methylobacterium soli TaxID=553447 RepID=A0A6L3SUJ3_9HYPH|nr:AraC family transcriptional regulator [Methylobacterium soli]KAB1077143.1 helix-turn-helix transcriptional regulator [Methylobacterium soli]GJE46977.1 HTH-type transcriptional activator RhaS [Methylobacterium soli]
MANIVRQAERWKRHSTPPKTLASYEEPGWEFQELEYGPGGAWDIVTAKLHIASHLDPLLQRIGPASAPFLLVPPSAAVSAPGDCLAGAWEGNGRSQHILISAGFVATTVGSDVSAQTVSRRRFARTRELDSRDQIISHLLEALSLEIRNGNPSGSLFLQAIVATLIYQALNISTFKSTNSPNAALSNEHLGLVFDLMDSQMAGRPSLVEFASLLGVSVQYFCRAFKMSTGLSPHQHMLRRRVEFARAMIETGSMPLSHVAQAAGFADQSQMAVTFRKVLKASPSHFRHGKTASE